MKPEPLNPEKALEYYRALSIPLVNESAANFLSLPPDQRAELLFYMNFYTTQMLKRIGQQLGIEATSLGEAVEALKHQ